MKGCGITILILLIIAIIGGGLYIYFHNQQEESNTNLEKVAWNKIKRFESELQIDSLEKAISDYQWNFPNGIHSAMVRTIKENLESEKRDWEKTKYTDDPAEMEEFILNHSDGYFRVEANRKLDSLSYFEAADIDTYESFEEYLDSYPDGMYAGEAKHHMDNFDSGEVSNGETTAVTETLIRHFVALSENNKNAIDETVADVLTTYIGKSGISRIDVEKYMESIHADKNRAIQFDIKNVNINKTVDNHTPIFEARFLLEEIITKDGHTDKIKFNGSARMNKEKQITSMILSQL